MTINEIVGLVMLASMINVIFVGLPISCTLLFIALVFGGIPVGNYQRTKNGRDTPVELELAVRVVLDAVRMAGLHKDEVNGVVLAHPGDHTKQGYFYTFLTSHLGLTSRSTAVQVIGNGMTGGLALWWNSARSS